MSELTRSGFTQAELDEFELTPATLAQGMRELDDIAANMGITWRQDESGSFDTSERTRYKTPGTKSGRGTVRTVSAKQAAFMRHLFATRDTSALKILPGFNGVENVSLAGARHLIDSLLACPIKPADVSATVTVRMATDKQASFIDSLATRKGSDIKGSEVTFDDASATIDRLKAMPDATPSVKVADTNDREPIVSGMVYRVGTRVFRVQKSRQSGNLYALELIGDDFEFARGAISLVMREGIKVAESDRAAYGKRTGRCMDCGRTLTNPVSIEYGIGPICRNK